MLRTPRPALPRGRAIAGRSPPRSGWWVLPLAVLGLCGWVALILAIT